MPAPKGQGGVIVGSNPALLPPGVAEMRDAILAAVESGRLEDLRLAIELNEMKPELGAPPGSDPIAHLRALSEDGEGRDILSVLGKLLAASYAAIPAGPDIENNRIYVWPHFAEVALEALSVDEVAALEALVTAETAAAMRAAGRWSWWRLSIGADGTWHMFTKTR